MLIVEGPDGAGKTMLVDRLARETGWPVAEKAVASDMTPKVPLVRWVDDHLARGFRPVIFDRFALISEPIYMPATRGMLRDDLPPLWFFDAYKRLLSRQPVMIWCLPPLMTVVDNVMTSDDHQPETVLDNITQIYWAYYFRWLTWVHGPNLRWDYTGAEAPNDFESLLRLVRKYMRGVLSD